MKRLFKYFALILILPLHGVFAQDISSSKIDSLVNRVLRTTPSVGIAVAVVKDGEVIHSKGYGIKTIQDKEKVDKNTLFAIASNSKAFTSAALAILVDEGKLKWEDRVVDYIPEFKMYNDYVTANFTIIDLLTHRSGLGLGAGDLMIFPDGADFTIDDVVKSFQYQKQVSDFRTKYDYDNLLYIVGGEVVSRISGMSWADFVETRIFAPLKMKNSVATYTKLDNTANLAMPHDSEGKDIKQLKTYESEILAAAGGIYSSVEDMSKWLLMQLKNGKYGDEFSKELFSERQQREMWKPHTNLRFTTKPNPRTKQHFSAYGLGWLIIDKQGKVILYHTGGLPGMLSKMIVVPELDLGIVVLTNSSPGGYAYSSISEIILDAYLEIEEVDWVTELANRAERRTKESDSVSTKVWEMVEKNGVSPIDLKNYTGTFQDKWFGRLEVSLKNGKLWMSSKRSPKLNGEMFYYKATTFAVKWDYRDMNADAFATFILDEEGEATGIKMKGISPNIDFSFDFEDLNLTRSEK